MEEFLLPPMKCQEYLLPLSVEKVEKHGIVGKLFER